MTEASPHTLKAFDDDLDRLRALVCELGGRVESSIADCVQAIVRSDPDRAAKVLADQTPIVGLVSRIEREAVQLIALRAPLADDLRDVLSAFKIVNLIARMGDCATNIARRAMLLNGTREIREIRTVGALGDGVARMVKGALDSYAVRDAAAAARVIAMDDEIDALHAGLFRALVDHMARQPETITAATHLVIVGQKLERAADHAASIAAMVHYAATGAPPSPPALEVRQ